MEYNSNPPLQVCGEIKLSIVSFWATRNYFLVLDSLHFCCCRFLWYTKQFFNLEYKPNSHIFLFQMHSWLGLRSQEQLPGKSKQLVDTQICLKPVERLHSLSGITTVASWKRGMGGWLQKSAWGLSNGRILCLRSRPRLRRNRGWLAGFGTFTCTASSGYEIYPEAQSLRNLWSDTEALQPTTARKARNHVEPWIPGTPSALPYILGGWPPAKIHRFTFLSFYIITFSLVAWQICRDHALLKFPLYFLLHLQSFIPLLSLPSCSAVKFYLHKT